jgi:secreted trypsin-like serine protease
MTSCRLCILFCIIKAITSDFDVIKDPISSSHDLKSRIIGGSPANPKRYPFFAILEIETVEFGVTMIRSCGGSLIETDVIMTAAHCLTSAVRISVIVNYTNTNSFEQTYYRESIFSVSHPNYNPDDLCSQNDIALIFINSPVRDVPVIPWNRKSSVPDPKNRVKVTTIGFGLTDLSLGTRPDKLMEISVQTLPNDICKQKSGSCSVQKSDVCIYHELKGVCFGDSGGPLLLQSKNTTKEMIQIGVVSRSKVVDPICIQADVPQIFTRISSYATWIDDMVCMHSKYKPVICPTLNPSTKRPTKRPTKKKQPIVKSTGKML